MNLYYILGDLAQEANLTFGDLTGSTNLQRSFDLINSSDWGLWVFLIEVDLSHIISPS